MKFEVIIKKYKGDKLVAKETKTMTMKGLKGLENKGYTVTLMGDRAIAEK